MKEEKIKERIHELEHQLKQEIQSINQIEQLIEKKKQTITSLRGGIMELKNLKKLFKENEDSQ